MKKTNDRFRYNLRIFRKAFLPWALSSPWRMWIICNFYAKIRNKYKLNAELQRRLDYPLPHSLVLSLTSDCNLSCDHCYARVYQETKILPREVLKNTLEQANSLGCFFFVLTGGEPMLYPDLLDILSHHKDCIFILITNGTMITTENARMISRAPYIIPVISLEGGKQETDRRRGTGTYHRVMNAFQNLQTHRVLYGFSITVTSDNMKRLQKEEVFLQKHPYGARLGCFIEYIPTGRSPTHRLILSPKQRASFREWFLALKKRTNIYLIHFPGDEDLMDNCREAGKGFVHINPEGYLESCALLPSSHYNVSTLPLEVCLERLYRENIQCSHLYGKPENHPCMSHRQNILSM